MADEVRRFLERLVATGPLTELSRQSGVVQLDLRDGKRTETWFCSVRKGEVTLSEDKQESDCRFSCDKALLAHIVTGETNAMAAVLRGALLVDGDLSLAMAFARVFRDSEACLGQHVADYERRAG